MEQNQKKNQNQQENQELQPRSPNLLFSIKTNSLKPIAEKYHVKFSLITKTLIVIIQVVFGVLIAWDSKTTKDIGKLEKNIQTMQAELNNQKQLLTDIENTIQKIEKLKKLDQTRPKMLAAVSKAINSTPRIEFITQTYIKPDTMTLITETDTALDVSILINKYLENKLAKEITVKSANLSKATNKYITSMEVIFK